MLKRFFAEALAPGRGGGAGTAFRLTAVLTVAVVSSACSKPEAPLEVPDGMVLVPGGEYSVGSGSAGEGPIRTVRLEGFFIDRQPVADTAFRTFMKTREDDWERYQGRLAQAVRAGHPGYPAASMTYPEAEAFCQAQGKRLPVAFEYEAAARGLDGRLFPWGNQWDESRVPSGVRGPVPLADTSGIVGPSGAQALVGNVFHWTRSTVSRTGFSAPERDQPSLRVIKAGGWPCISEFNRATFRAAMNDSFHSPFVGFRCVRPTNPTDDKNLALETLPESFTDKVFDTSEKLRQLFSYELLPSRMLHPEIADHIKTVPPGSVVADVGAGIGFLSFILSDAVGVDGRVFAVDIDESVLELIDSCGHLSSYPNITTVHNVPDDAKLPEASCDQVYLLGTVHCLNEETWKPFIRSCYRALKPGGLLVVQDNLGHPVVGVVASSVAEEGFELVAHAGRLLPAERGDSSAPPRKKIEDLRQQPAEGYLWRVYRKR